MSKPIPTTEANNMIKTYNSYMTGLGVDMKKQTTSVGFALPELMSWLSKMTDLADEIRVCMGDYPAGHPQAGRTTVILWPYKNGQPAKYPIDAMAGDKPGSVLNTDDEGDGDPVDGDPGDDDDDDDDDDENGGGGGGVDPFNEGTLLP